MIKHILVITSLGLTFANMALAKHVEGMFTCVEENTGMSFSGLIGAVPGRGTLELDGEEMDAKWSYKPNCFISRADQLICREPDTIFVTLRKSEREFSGSITVYSESSYAYLNQLEPQVDNWHHNFSCNWN